MLSLDVLLTVCLGYVALLFAVAFIVDRRARTRPIAWLQSPLVYTFSISVYCTSWTFYGAVGSAARSGLEFVTIYLGPTLVFIGWWWLLRKLVRIGRAHRITSIADLISSRYGKSSSLAVLVTVIAVIATTPYIALQLQSVTRSYQVIAGEADGVTAAFWIAAGMALFTILFGTRNLDANERHHGVVAAIALEAIVKLGALLAVGIFATFIVADGFHDVFADVPAEVIIGTEDIFGPRWVALTFLSATAIICLPRQFQVTVVENIEERHLATASWLFPLYLFGMTLFIMPIAIVGLKVMPEGANPDLFVLTLPLAEQRNELALFAFLGGFSSATSMVIVAAIAVSTMVSNHIVVPVALRLLAAGRAVRGDVRTLLLLSRRISIAAVLGLGFLYFKVSGGSDALAAIGLIAFVGVAQFLPSLLGGLFWHGATRARSPASSPAPCSGPTPCSCRASAARPSSASRSFARGRGAWPCCVRKPSSASPASTHWSMPWSGASVSTPSSSSPSPASRARTPWSSCRRRSSSTSSARPGRSPPRSSSARRNRTTCWCWPGASSARRRPPACSKTWPAPRASPPACRAPPTP